MKNVFVIILLAFFTISGYSQNLTRTGVTKAAVRNVGSIIQDNRVTGYYQFFRMDKSDKKNYNYELNVLDENLRLVSTIQVARPKTFFLLEGVFNGTSFGFLFYDTKTKSMELISYDRTLKQLGSANLPVKNKQSVVYYKMITEGSNLTSDILVPVNNAGFLVSRATVASDTKYRLEFFDNNLKSLWVREAEQKSENRIELADYAFQTDQYIGSIISQKKFSTSKNQSEFMMVQDKLTGREIFNVPMTVDQYSLAFADVFYEASNNTFIVFGEYFNVEDKELKARSLGLMTVTFDIQGKIVSKKVNSWMNDISKVAPVNEKGKFDGNNTSLLFHEIIRTADGKIFAIAEQYKKAANALGIASNVLSIAAMSPNNNVANVQLNVYNMVVFEFNADQTLRKVHSFEKDKNVLMLPGGYGNLSNRMLSYYAKAVGGFDYSFTQQPADKNTFFISYINYDREKGERAKNVLGTIVYTPEKTFTVDKLAMNRKSSEYFVYRAKDGYVLVTEYFRKEKRLETRLEKVNY
jgi:hypothetical protein